MSLLPLEDAGPPLGASSRPRNANPGLPPFAYRLPPTAYRLLPSAKNTDEYSKSRACPARANFHHGPVLSAPRCLSLCLCCVSLALRSAGEPEAPFRSLANLRPQQVLAALPTGGGTRLERLAWATAQMGDQPVTDGNLRASERVLAELAAGNDEIAAEATYLRARLFQLHFSTPDHARAAALYRELASRWPRSHWAQLGLVKLALLELYQLPGAATEEARITTAEQLLARIEEPRLRRDLQLQIGLAGISLRVPIARYLPHLVAAARFGGINGSAREDILVQVGVLSARIGAWTQAQEFFERYLQEFPNNARAFAVRERLAAVRAQLAKEGGS